MYTIKLLSPTEIDNNIDHIITEISRADDDTLRIEDIADELTGPEYDLYACIQDDNTKYYLLACIMHKTYFVLRVVGGSKLFPWPDFLEHALPIIKSKDCTNISFNGAPYWEDKVKDLGFKIKEYTYTVGV